MKQTKRIPALLLALVMVCTLSLTGCRKEPPLAADQVAVALFEMILKDNPAPSVELFGYADEAAAREDWSMDDGSLCDQLAEKLAGKFESMQIQVTQEDMQMFVDAFLSMFSQMELSAKVKESDKKAGTAMVTCTVSTFDAGATTDAITQTMTEIFSNPDLRADKAALTSAMLSAISTGIASLTPNGGTADFDVDFKLSTLAVNGKRRQAWLPADVKAFSAAISTNAMSG